MELSTLQHWIGSSLLILGILISAFGVYALLRLNHFYARIVITSKIETMGLLTMMIGAMILTGFSLLTGKIALIVIFELLTMPVGSHAAARSAYVNGFRVKTVTSGDGQDDRQEGTHA